MSQEESESTLTKEEIIKIRQRAEEALVALQKELGGEEECKSWIQDTVVSDASESCRFFDAYGFLRVPNFADEEEVAAIKKETHDAVERDWNPSQKIMAFATEEEANLSQGSNDYFLESASRVHFFAEANALDEETKTLKPEYRHDNNKMDALNKIGHGMHCHEGGAAHSYTTSPKVRLLVKELGWVDPVVPQSMYICKNPGVGGAVCSHQDSTFLHTTPKPSCLGLWLALDHATLENGCLWVRPKSHRERLRRQFIRNPDYFTQEVIDERSNVGKGDLDQPKTIFVKHHDYQDKVPWEGALPSKDSLLEAGFLPVECRAGDLLAFPGHLDHLSLPNLSNAPRHTFQLHLVEGPGANVEWSKTNWLQYPKGKPFLRLNT